MAKCGNCSNEISTEAAACPSCGHPNPEIEKRKKAKSSQSAAVLAMALGLLMVFLPIPYNVMFLVAPLAFATGAYAAFRGPAIVTRIGGGFAVLLSLVGFAMIYDTHQKITQAQEKLAELKTEIDSATAKFNSHGSAITGLEAKPAAAENIASVSAAIESGLKSIAPTKLAVEEAFQNSGALPGTCAGLEPACKQGVSVTNGKITVDLGGYAVPSLVGKVLAFSPSVQGDNLVWRCTANVEKQYLPDYCETN